MIKTGEWEDDKERTWNIMKEQKPQQQRNGWNIYFTSYGAQNEGTREIDDLFAVVLLNTTHKNPTAESVIIQNG
jgi:hypothetical protein